MILTGFIGLRWYEESPVQRRLAFRSRSFAAAELRVEAAYDKGGIVETAAVVGIPTSGGAPSERPQDLAVNRVGVGSPAVRTVLPGFARFSRGSHGSPAVR